MTTYAGQRTTSALFNQVYGMGDTAASTVTQTTFTNLSSAYTIPAGEPVAGSAYELECAGEGVWGSTAQSLGIASSLNNTAPTAWAGVAAAAFPAGTVFDFWVRLKLICADGASQWSEFLSGMFAPHSAYIQPGTPAANGVPIIHWQADTAAVSSNIQVAIQAKWLSTTGTPTLTSQMTTFRRIS